MEKTTARLKSSRISPIVNFFLSIKNKSKIIFQKKVSEEELKRLWKRFKKLDKDNSGTLTTDEFLSVPELASNPLLERVLAIFDTNKDDEIEFKEFISALATFSEKGNTEAKLKCLSFTFFSFSVFSKNFAKSRSKFMIWTEMASFLMENYFRFFK